MKSTSEVKLDSEREEKKKMPPAVKNICRSQKQFVDQTWSALTRAHELLGHVTRTAIVATVTVKTLEWESYRAT